MTERCEGFPRDCTNEATRTVKGYRFCLTCARAFAGYTPEPIEAPLLDRLAALLAAARAWRDGAGEQDLRAAIAALDEPKKAGE